MADLSKNPSSGSLCDPSLDPQLLAFFSGASSMFFSSVSTMVSRERREFDKAWLLSSCSLRWRQGTRKRGSTIASPTEFTKIVPQQTALFFQTLRSGSHSWILIKEKKSSASFYNNYFLILMIMRVSYKVRDSRFGRVLLLVLAFLLARPHLFCLSSSPSKLVFFLGFQLRVSTTSQPECYRLTKVRMILCRSPTASLVS